MQQQSEQNQQTCAPPEKR